MNIIEEQNKIDQSNPDLKGNMDASTKSSSAKKVYSKPTLIILTSNKVGGNKTHVTSRELGSIGGGRSVGPS